MFIKRKEFIQVGSLATASMLLPKFLKAFEGPAFVPPGNKVVVVLQLSGGNDGLNTVIPFRNDLYYKARPRLGIVKDKALGITGQSGTAGLLGIVVRTLPQEESRNQSLVQQIQDRKIQ